MTIAAVNAATQVANMSAKVAEGSPSATPNQVELDKFNQIMFGTAHKLPEENTLNAVQDHHQLLKNNLTPVADIAHHGITTENLLQSQAQLMSSGVSVDLEAKVAGQLAQAVNKLVTMQ